MLGMYVHTHWGYGYPYSARTWRLADWERYLTALSSLGYDMLMVWPQLDCMPPEPNDSDRAFLGTLADAIDLAHERLGMFVAVVACPNTIGNAKSSTYEYAARPYFVCENRINPADPSQMKAFLAGRRNQFELLARADALSIIDSDPGGYVGSPTEEFVDLLVGQIDAFRSLNPSAELIYWMLMGWETYNRFWAAEEGLAPEQPPANDNEFTRALQSIQRRIGEPWWVLASSDSHRQALSALGITDKALWFPYALCEAEPSFPLTNCFEATLAGTLTADSLSQYPRGVMANCQTHCLQLPNTYMFSRLATEASPESLDLVGFADSVLPGKGKLIARSWRAIGDGDAMRAAADELRPVVHQDHTTGDLAGLLFGSAERFLDDLVTNLELRAALLDFGAAVDAGGDTARTLRCVLNTLQPYQKRVGFNDAYAGPLSTELNEPLKKLGDSGIDAAMTWIGQWRDPSGRHGVVTPLLEAMDAYVTKTLTAD